MDVTNKRLYFGVHWLVAIAIIGLIALQMNNELASQDKRAQEQWLTLQQAQITQNDLYRRDSLRQAELFARLVSKDKAVIALALQAYRLKPSSLTQQASQNAAIRTQLQQALEPYWAAMTALGARELNLHLEPHGRVFFRAANTRQFDDDAELLSPLLSNVLQTGAITMGTEVGHAGTTYRAISPIIDEENPLKSPIAAIEAGLNPLPMGDNVKSHGQALLLQTHLAQDVLWEPQNVKKTANNSTWSIETSTNTPLWLTDAFLESIAIDNQAPWLMTHAGKTYLLSVEALTLYAPPRTPKTTPKALLLRWEDVTEQITANTQKRQVIITTALSLMLIIGLLFLAVFVYYRRYLRAKEQEYQQTLHTEHAAYEHARHQLTLALASSESGFWEWDIANNRTQFSKEWRELCGLPMDNTERADVEEWLNIIHPSDKRPSYNQMIRHIKGETPMFESEYRVKVANGSYKWIYSRGIVVKWSQDGKASLMLGVYTDITQRKESEIIVLRQQSAFTALNTITSISMLNMEDQLRQGLTIALGYLGLESGVISHIQGNQYTAKIAVGKAASLSQSPDVLSNYLCELTVRNNSIIAQDDIGNSDYADHYAYKIKSCESYFGIPITLKGENYGTLCFTSQKPRHQAYDDLDKEFMRLLARWAAVALERWQHQSEQQTLIDRFDLLCDQLPGFLFEYILYPDGLSYVPFASAGIDEIYGVTAKEVKSDAQKIFSMIHPADVGWVSQSISHSAMQLSLWSATYRINHPKRGEIWVRGLARPTQLEDGATLWHGYLQDITDEKQSALKLQEINSLREAIFDAASIAIISTDANGIIKTFNQGAEDLLGYYASEVIDKLTPAPFHLPQEIVARAEQLSLELRTSVLPGFDAFIAKAREGDVDENEWTYVHRNGQQIPIILSVSSLRNADGEITGYLGLARDISELKRIDRMKTEFISTVSHELRTPLTAISGALGIIVNGAAGSIPDNATKMLNIAHRNSLRLIHLVNDLLDMEKLVAGKMNFDFKQQLLLPIITQSVEANAAYAAQYNVNYVVTTKVDEGVRINVDAQRLQQVLANFLSNAAKFAPINSIVEVSIEAVFNNVRVSVIDKGPGIPEEFRSRIFQKFSQADSSDTRQKGGTGLGLAICKEMIERMGGKIGFFSEVGQGSQFYFELPNEELPSKLPEPTDSRTANGEKLLIVEDDPEVAELLATILRQQHYRVDIAYSAQAALKRLTLNSYKVITVDIQLPDMDGMDLIKHIRTDALRSQIPIIVLSANIDNAQRTAQQNPLFDHIQWLQKPQTPEALIAAIRNAR